MKADEKTCPACAETIKKAAVVCKHCGHKFTAAEVSAGKNQTDNANAAAGCITLLILVAVVAMCSSGDSETDSKSAAATAAEAAENRRKGFHCLSGWDGSSRQFVEQVKSNLRDPESFEHEETRITPVDEKGQHTIAMKYRARNGFGGMNIETALGTISQATCDATLLSSG